MIEPAVVEAIADRIGTEGLDGDLTARLKNIFPGIPFTLCSDDDIGNARPVLERPGFNLYLVDGSDSCLRLGEDYGSATGVVIAEVFDDEDV